MEFIPFGVQKGYRLGPSALLQGLNADCLRSKRPPRGRSQNFQITSLSINGKKPELFRRKTADLKKAFHRHRMYFFGMDHQGPRRHSNPANLIGGIVWPNLIVPNLTLKVAYGCLNYLISDSPSGEFCSMPAIGFYNQSLPAPQIEQIGIASGYRLVRADFQVQAGTWKKTVQQYILTIGAKRKTNVTDFSFLDLQLFAKKLCH